MVTTVSRDEHRGADGYLGSFWAGLVSKDPGSMRDVRVVVYGVGAMGSILTRLLLDKGVQIVGAIGRSPEKVGRDLGEVAGLGWTIGVAVESDPHRALADGADIAVVCVIPSPDIEDSSHRDILRAG